MKWLAIDGPLYTLSVGIYRSLILSVCMLVCCVPIITMPVGIAAAFGVARGIARGQTDSLFRAFLEKCKENLWQSLIYGWGLVIVGCLLWLDSRLLTTEHASILTELMRVLLAIVGLVYLYVCLNVFPLMVHMRLSTGRLMISALKLSFFKPYLTLLNSLILYIMMLVASHFPLTVVLLYPGVAVWVTYGFANRKFQAITSLQK